MEQRIFSHDPVAYSSFSGKDVTNPAQLYQNITTTVKLASPLLLYSDKAERDL